MTRPVSRFSSRAIDSAYDNYAAQYNALFVSGAGNGGPSKPAGDVLQRHRRRRLRRQLKLGPTLDNGRAKPDITAPAGAYTSFSTPHVAGAAAVLMQAGLRGDGGSDTNSAADIRTVKALLLNGAVKPADWTNNPPSPLDTRYGAGILNVFNSYEQLAGGKHGYIVSTSVPTGSAHPPTGASGTIGALSGWDFNTNTSSSSFRRDKSLLFQRHQRLRATPRSPPRRRSSGTASRTRPTSTISTCFCTTPPTAISSRAAPAWWTTSNTSSCRNLPQGRYDLQVWKAGGIPDTTIVSSRKPMRWHGNSPQTLLNATQSGTNLSLTWPIYPDGFVLASATNLTPPVVWSTNNPAPVVTNNLNQVLVSATNASQFFRLQPP